LKPKIAITGGAGFIGKSLARHLSEKFQVRILDIQKPSRDLEGFVGYTFCDIRNFHEARNALKGADFVIHTAIVQIPLINEQKSLGYAVNVVGTQNVCEAVEKNPRIKGMILAGTWHTIGERDLQGTIDEEFGFRPDKVEDRARLYALSKMAQEAIVRYYDEMSSKIYGIIRMGTVLGVDMPRETAASIFIRKGLLGEPITPFRHSMHRPMLYVDIGDICKAYENYASGVLNGKIGKGENSLVHIVNVYFPQPMTILELAETVCKTITECTHGKTKPKVEILDKGLPPLFREDDKKRIRVSVEKARVLLGLEKLTSPEVALRRIIRLQLQQCISVHPQFGKHVKRRIEFRTGNWQEASG
jgi:UDP-glucose 4-epimerase